MTGVVGASAAKEPSAKDATPAICTATSACAAASASAQRIAPPTLTLSTKGASAGPAPAGGPGTVSEKESSAGASGAGVLETLGVAPGESVPVLVGLALGAAVLVVEIVSEMVGVAAALCVAVAVSVSVGVASAEGVALAVSDSHDVHDGVGALVGDAAAGSVKVGEKESERETAGDGEPVELSVNVERAVVVPDKVPVTLGEPEGESAPPAPPGEPVTLTVALALAGPGEPVEPGDTVSVIVGGAEADGEPVDDALPAAREPEGAVEALGEPLADGTPTLGVAVVVTVRDRTPEREPVCEVVTVAEALIGPLAVGDTLQV